MKLGVGRLDWDPTLERLIGVVRLALAAFALFIVWVDPTQPSKHVTIAYAAFIVYLVYSPAAFQLVRTQPRPWLLVTTQIIDLLWIPPVLLFTEAGNTPFFPFFVVIMLTAGIRWGIWASWAVTAYSLVVYGFLFRRAADSAGHEQRPDAALLLPHRRHPRRVPGRVPAAP
jgi:hypothetical protein